MLAMTIAPVRASDLHVRLLCANRSCFERPDGAAPLSQRRLRHRVAVFSDNPKTIHDPRHPQSQTGAHKMFAPIGLISSNHRVPHQYGAISKLHFDTGTAFLVSPCYVLTAYHVVFGNGPSEPEADQDYSMTFSVHGKTSRAVPAKFGEFYRYEGRDWALLRLDPDAEHRCLGEDPRTGWVRLARLSSHAAKHQSLSLAGYPSDKDASSLWRQDTCHLFHRLSGKRSRGLWTTDCATRPRASGSPIFFVRHGVLNVVAIMHGHIGVVVGNEILPKWNPRRANLAVDIGDIISSNPDFLKLIDADIARFHHPNPAAGKP